MVKTPWLRHWSPFSDNTLINLIYILKLLQSCRLGWRRAPAPPGAFGAGACVGITSAPARRHRPARSGILVLSEPFPHSVPFFRWLFGVIPALSHGALQEQPLMGRTGRCAAPSPGADLPAEPAPPPSPRSFTLPSPRPLPDALADGKVREHRELGANRGPAVLCAGGSAVTPRGEHGPGAGTPRP